MIGQENLLQLIHQQIDNDKFPRFSIIVGPKGSGKKELAKEMFKYLGSDGSAAISFCGITVDAVRNMITDAYKIIGILSVYVIPDADSMSVQAKNALLKVTEEPPNNAYFIMTLEDENNTLDTIRSRGTVYHIENYSSKDIQQYSQIVYQDNKSLYYELCDTPGEVDILYKEGIEDFYAYVELAVGNIQKVSLANALKMSNRIALKDDAEGYDLKLFWKAFMKVCSTKMIKEPEYVEWIRLTSKALQRLKIRGINKQMLFDNWVFEIREWR